MKRFSFRKFFETAGSSPGRPQAGYIVTVGLQRAHPISYQTPDDEVDLGGGGASTRDYQQFGPFADVQQAVAEFQRHLNQIHSGQIVHISMSYYNADRTQRKDLVHWNWTNDRENVGANERLPAAVQIKNMLRVPPPPSGGSSITHPTPHSPSGGPGQTQVQNPRMPQAGDETGIWHNNGGSGSGLR